jgi:hypothetical protein
MAAPVAPARREARLFGREPPLRRRRVACGTEKDVAMTGVNLLPPGHTRGQIMATGRRRGVCGAQRDIGGARPPSVFRFYSRRQDCHHSVTLDEIALREPHDEIFAGILEQGY